MGNPLHVILFLQLMIYNGFLKQNKLYLEEESGQSEEIIPEWAKNNPIIKWSRMRCDVKFGLKDV